MVAYVAVAWAVVDYDGAAPDQHDGCESSAPRGGKNLPNPLPRVMPHRSLPHGHCRNSPARSHLPGQSQCLSPSKPVVSLASESPRSGQGACAGTLVVFPERAVCKRSPRYKSRWRPLRSDTNLPRTSELSPANPCCLCVGDKLPRHKAHHLRRDISSHAEIESVRRSRVYSVLVRASHSEIGGIQFLGRLVGKHTSPAALLFLQPAAKASQRSQPSTWGIPVRERAFLGLSESAPSVHWTTVFATLSQVCIYTYRRPHLHCPVQESLAAAPTLC